jgi:hypothetical protein
MLLLGSIEKSGFPKNIQDYRIQSKRSERKCGKIYYLVYSLFRCIVF